MPGRRLLVALLAGIAAAVASFVLVAAGSSPPAPEPTCHDSAARSAGVRCQPVGSTQAVASTERATSVTELDDDPSPTPAARLHLPPVADPERPATILGITEPSPSLPNPFVLVDDDRYLMFTTEARDAVGAKQNVPVLESTDLRSWDFVRDALPDVGEWAVPEATWAPDVTAVRDGWALYYTARLAAHDPPTQCIGVGTSDRPIGPYVPAPEPLVCQLDRGGSIDPRTFRDDDGTVWLHWKSDENADVEGTSTSSVHAQRLSPDGTSLVGEPTEILEVTQPWEGRIVEAPQLIEVDGRFWLFYSGNWFNQPAYAVGVAECDGPSGPCTKPFDGPWLASNAQGAGPGEASLFRDLAGRWRIVYSPLAQQYRTETDRPIALATVGFDDRGPYLAHDGPPAARAPVPR